MNGNIRSKVELGPGDAEQRTALFEAFKAGGADVGGNWALAAKWRQLAAKIVAKPTDEDEAEELYEQVVTVAAKFLATHLPKYDAAMRNMARS
jgi:hypothetical protein